jgi:molybdopterin converting factor subunit 1
MVTVQLFARAADLAGGPRVELDLPEAATIGDLRAALIRARPELAAIAAKLLVAMGQNYVRDHDLIQPGAEIACFPPVSGG